MPDRYDPPEAAIQKTMEKADHDPRKLAIAYLRAQRRARENEAAFNLMGDVQDLTMSAMRGDVSSAEEAVNSAGRHSYQSRDIRESE